MRLVVPAFRAGPTLPRCLEALRVASASLGEEAELLLVDDGENGEVVPLAARHGFAVVQRGPSGSAAIARNRGAEGAHSGIIVFVDADVAVDRDALRRLVAPIRAGLADATIGNYSEETTGLTFLQSYKQLYISCVYARRSGLLQNQFWTALCAVRAEVFHELGGFAPAFKGACDEDTELGFRLTRAGKRVMAVPEAKGVNLKPFTLKTLILNDLHKGTSTLMVAYHNRVAMGDNRHASRADVVAVALSCATLAAPAVAAVAQFGSWTAVPVVGLGVLHLAARHDLLRTFGHHRGVAFAAAAVGTMFVLDLVRAVCVARALWALACGGARHGVQREQGAPVPKETGSC